MRKIATLLLAFTYLGATAQTGTPALYGYMRPSHPGIVPAGVENATLADYLIYITHPAKGSFRLRSVTIGGKNYTFTTERSKAPVTYVNRNLPQQPKTVTLVPRGKGVAEQVVLRNGPDRPGAGPLTVRFTWNGKTYTRSLKAWKELEPIMHE